MLTVIIIFAVMEAVFAAGLWWEIHVSPERNDW